MTARRSPFMARASSSYVAFVVASAWIVCPTAHAQPAPAVAATPASASGSAPAASSPAAVGQTPAATAKASLAAGEKSAKAKDWAGALTSYTAANTAVPSAGAQEGIANAHYELKHQGEAYDAYDQFLKQYGNAIGTGRKKVAETRLKELATLTGYVSIRVNESGASVSIDGNAIGATPVAALIRVTTGVHKVSITKDGFAPVEKAPTIASNGKEIVEINLVREAKTGHLVVKEKSGAQVRVVLDGTDVGAAPFETDLDPGTHEILVRSSTLAAPAQKVEITKGKTSEIELVAVSATAHLEVTTNDRQGIIFLDGKPVAEGAFASDVAVGPHIIAVTREGFEKFEKTVTLADKQALAETVTLKRPQADTSQPGWSEDRAYTGLYGGFGVMGLLESSGNGNELETHCSQLGAASCSTPAPLGASLFGWFGYSWNPVGLELFLAGMYDQTTPSATFTGAGAANANPLVVSVPRVEQFYMGRFGGVAAVRARLTFQSAKIRGSLAAGFGLSVKDMIFERDSKTSDGLKNVYVDKSGTTYVSPALSIDGSIGFRVNSAITILLGLNALLETAGDDVTTPPSKNEYIGGNGSAYPIPTPAYHMASSTQVFLGPYLGLGFGP